MKNCYFFALPLLAFLFSKNVASGQTPARPDAEVYLRVGGNLSGWDESGGVLVGLEGHRRLAGRLGLVGNWMVGLNTFDSSGEDDWEWQTSRKAYFSTSKIGLTLSGKKERLRWSGGVAHQFWPENSDFYDYQIGWCGMTTAGEQEAYMREIRSKEVPKNLFGFSASMEMRFRLFGRLRGSAALDFQVFHNQKNQDFDPDWVRGWGLTVGVGF